jgi:hypothetical protein
MDARLFTCSGCELALYSSLPSQAIVALQFCCCNELSCQVTLLSLLQATTHCDAPFFSTPGTRRAAGLAGHRLQRPGGSAAGPKLDVQRGCAFCSKPAGGRPAGQGRCFNSRLGPSRDAGGTAAQRDHWAACAPRCVGGCAAPRR